MQANLVAEEPTSWIVLAHLVRPQGRKGELLADLLTDFPERFETRKEVYLAPPGFEGNRSEVASTEIVSHWLPHGRNQGRIVFHFSHVKSIEQAERLAGLDVLVSEEARLELTDGSVYVNELIGCDLYDGEVAIGRICDVQYVTTSDGKRRLTDTATLLVVDLAPGEALIPFAKEYLTRLEIAEKRIVMNLPQGLLDVNDRHTNARPKSAKPDQ